MRKVKYGENSNLNVPLIYLDKYKSPYDICKENETCENTFQSSIFPSRDFMSIPPYVRMTKSVAKLLKESHLSKGNEFDGNYPYHKMHAKRGKNKILLEYKEPKLPLRKKGALIIDLEEIVPPTEFHIREISNLYRNVEKLSEDQNLK